MRISPQSIPLHVARAYGVQPAPAPAPIARSTPASSDAARSSNIQRLVAGRVPGGIDFSADEPQPTEATLPMYRHPADRNAAATSIHAGGMIDVSG